MQKSTILILILFSFFIKSSAQYSGMSFEVHYPLVFSDENNTYSDSQGVLGGTLQYQFTENIPYNFGLEYKFDLVQTVERLSEYSEPTKRNFLISNINVFGKMLFITVPELQIYASGGFTQYKYKNTTAGRSHLGFNVGGGLSYDIYDKIYILSNYSLLKTNLKDNSGEFSKDETHQVIRMGLGFKF